MAKVAWGFIGTGHLSQSLIRGAIARNVLSPSQVIVFNRTKEKAIQLAQDTRVRIAEDLNELCSLAEVIVLGTKPQDLSVVLSAIENCVTSSHRVISLAAGVTTQTLSKSLKARQVVRVMANLPAQIGCGAFGIYSSASVPEDMIQYFSALGEVFITQNEKQLDALTAASASGVGFVYFVMEAFQSWMQKKGFTEEHAHHITLQTFLGSAQYAQEADKSFAELRESVTSKKGTTLAGLLAMKKARVFTGLLSGLEAAFKRSQELARESLSRSKK